MSEHLARELSRLAHHLEQLDQERRESEEAFQKRRIDEMEANLQDYENRIQSLENEIQRLSQKNREKDQDIFKLRQMIDTQTKYLLQNQKILERIVEHLPPVQPHISEKNLILEEVETQKDQKNRLVNSNQLLDYSKKKEQRLSKKTKIAFPPEYNPGRRFSVSAEPPSSMKSVSLRKYPKNFHSREKIKQIITKNILFQHLDEEQLEKCIEVMFEKNLKAGEVIIQQGADGDNFYVIDEGKLDVEKDGKPVNQLGPGRSFGELALMYNVPRNATVKAREDSKCWGMDRIAFRTILMENAKRKREKYENFLADVPIFASLESYERATIADALEPVTFEDGDVIIREGEAGDIFYIIEEGEVVITRSRSVHGNVTGKPVEVSRLGTGGYFGEVALLTNKPRAANVIAVGDCKCLAMNRKDFEQLMGPCAEIIKRNMDHYKTYEEILGDSNQTFSQII